MNRQQPYGLQPFHWDPKYGPHIRPLQQQLFHTCELEDCENKVSWYVMSDVRTTKELVEGYGFVTTECGREISGLKKVRYILGEIADLWLCDKHKNELTECGCLNGYYFQVNSMTGLQDKLAQR